jgi:hypothetical protein
VTGPGGSAPPEGAVTLAARVLAEARAGHWAETAALAGQLAREYGADGQLTLVYGVADAVGVLAGAVHGKPVQVTPVWQEHGSGEITGPEAVSPETAWAGRFLAARIAWDREACDALMAAVPDDETWSRNVSALISIAALTINRMAGAA